MDIQRLRYFVETAQRLHFSEAARQLGISQPTLSQQIRVLEREVGAPLFVRSSRSVELTAAGSVLLTRVVRILDDLRDAAEEAREASQHLGGHLRLGCLQSDIPAHCAEIVSAYQLRYPHVRLDLVRKDTAQRLKALRAHEVDAAFVRLHCLDDASLDFVPLRKEPLVLVLASGHPLAAAEEIFLRDLDGSRLAFFCRDQNPQFYDDVHAVLDAEGVRVQTVHEARDEISILPLIAAGDAISFFGLSKAAVLAYHGVSYRRLTPELLTTGLGFVSRKDTHLPALESLKDLIQELIEERGWAESACDEMDGSPHDR